MKTVWMIFVASSLLFTTTSLARPVKNITDKEVIDAYQYLMARILVLRQENLDFTKDDMKWNEIKHRDVGGVQWANPNLDVAYSEAWVAIDQNSCTIVEIPEIKDRYYTVQFLNGWGETTANLNDRTYPKHPFGKFAVCSKDSQVTLAPEVQKVILPSKKSRILARVELGKDPNEAVKLQRQIKIYPTGKPEITESPKIVEFEHDQLPGIEIFENAASILSSEKDINPNMGGLQIKVLTVERTARHDNSREATAKIIREKAIPSFFALKEKVERTKNGWNLVRRFGNYGNDYQARALVNYAGIWANNNNEAVYYSARNDAKGELLDGSAVYTLTFPKDKLPSTRAKYFWSITGVDSKNYKVIPNPANKFVINNRSNIKPNADGSVTLYFASKLPLGAPEENWLPTPAGSNYNLTFRFYGPSKDVVKGNYFPPGLVKQPSLTKVDSESIY
ncbi:DUF1254 domain-containing protein [Bdellovibrio sp. ZAP7]|uniref:DUF1214 domain-containing protein n=1 Tax=Bdellovibrio sp. ZAP7 TaxID=2231053 RepID=UPI0011584BFF|nr:DUF1214 domain-containing protein [Bdellovibrio sp. ZAP7]QDK45023.1 DUF1254 domain-containing protein [Bdellovibrio sp. ZAP7]